MVQHFKKNHQGITLETYTKTFSIPKTYSVDVPVVVSSVTVSKIIMGTGYGCPFTVQTIKISS